MKTKLKIPPVKRSAKLTDAERIAINVLHRKGVRSIVLAKVFKVSKNMIYARCLTGSGMNDGCVKGDAERVNSIVRRLGVEKAFSDYVTDPIIRKVNAVSAEHVPLKPGRPTIWER